MKRKTIIIILIFTISSISAPFITTQGELENSARPLSESVSDMNESELLNLLAEETQEVKQYSKLKEMSSSEELEVSKLTSYLPLKSVQSFDTEEYWLLNFTYIKEYSWTFNQNKDGSVFQYDLNETFTITLFAFFPVVLAIYRNYTSSADSHIQIITEAIVDPRFEGKAGILFEFEFDFVFSANILGFKPSIGPGSIPLSHEKNWTYDTPLDGDLALGKKDILFSVIPQFPPLKLGASIEPRLDSDFSAQLRANDSQIILSQDKLKWEKSNSIQSFSAYVPEFFADSIAIIDLFDFNMVITLNLDFFLTAKLDVPILRNYPLRLKLFSFPIASVGLECENVDTINLETTITASEKLPFVYGVFYDYSDSQGDNDRIIEPGEVIDFNIYITNLGEGSALSINTTVSSDNATVTGEDSADILLRNRGNFEMMTGFQFTVPAVYTANIVIVTASFEYFSLNGSYFVDTYDMYFRVVEVSDTYLEVSDVFFNYDGDNWYAGDEIDIAFKLTNRGARDIYYADVSVFAGYDTDQINTATLTSSLTNASSLVLTPGESVTLGNISISAPAEHDDGLIYLYLDVHYEDDTYVYFDPLDFAIPIYVLKPDFSITSAVGYETDSDSYFEAGETVYLEFTIENIGNGFGYDITGYLTSDSTDLNFTNSYVYFNNLAPTGSDTSSYAILEIPLTARNQTANFTLYVSAYDSKGHLIIQQFLITIEIVEAPSPEISLLYYVLDDDLYGDGDGFAEPGEICFIYVYIQVDNVAFMLKGSLETAANLIIYNSSSYYGNLMDQSSSGDGFIIEVPLSYDGQNATIYIDITGESYSGRKIAAYGYIDLSLGKGDLTAPVLELVDTFSSSVITGEEYSFNYNVTDPTISGEFRSGLDTLMLLWTFNGGEVQQNEYIAVDLEGEWILTIDTSFVGIYEIIIVAVDAAGNVEFLGNGENPFIIEVLPLVNEYGNLVLFSLIIPIIVVIFIVKTINKKKRRNL